MMTQKSVLIVDDVPMNLDLLETIIEHGGFRPITATGGEEAIDILKSESPDMLLLDMMMPRVDGFGVLDYLQSQDHLKDTPVIFLSANHDPQQRQKALDRGVIAFIDKPYDMREVLRLVKESTADKADDKPE